MKPPPKLRPAIEKRLSLPRYGELLKAVESALTNQYPEDAIDFWDFALGLRDSWNSMARAPENEVKKTVAELADLVQALARKLVAFSPEIRTLRGHTIAEIGALLSDDLITYARSLSEENAPTEAMQSRPRSMALKSAERTYLARALTHFLLEIGTVSGNAVSKRSALVAMTVNALLDIGSEDEFDAKDVEDLTDDIVQSYRKKCLNKQTARNRWNSPG
ncbi:MAG: hypothetical protein BWK72_17425 [Rhodoferax ferrireducens]|uniref:Uncharacterized protein n=1 Tax=Rhodoferax ferrireducens TaxID=192843 RepID=A0A1W9KQA7_9BURK|nr:MAG: hypothetical protein BWK72_17425 [Rhodoferax ferrireducens]